MANYTAIVMLVAIAVYFFFSAQVGVARGKFGVKQPAATGNLDFERVFRAHTNTLEWMPIFVVSLWLCAIYLSDISAAALGAVWIVGRIIYFYGYSRSVEGRTPGFFVQSIACILLFIGAAIGIARHMIGG